MSKTSIFFDDLNAKIEAKQTWSAGVAFKRANPLPLDSSSVYETEALALEYVNTSSVVYPGQVIAYADADNNMIVCVTQEKSDGTGYELARVGVVPTAGAAIDVTDGSISAKVDGKSVVIVDNALAIAGFKDATSLTLPQKQADGTIAWVSIDAIVDGDGNTQYTFTSQVESSSVHFDVKSSDDESAQTVYLDAYSKSEIDAKFEAIPEDKDTTYSVAEGEKILKLDGTVFSTVASLKYVPTVKADAEAGVEAVNAKIQLLGIDGALVSEIDATDFIKDGMLDDVSYDAESNSLTFTWKLADGTTKTETVEISDMLAPYTEGNGISIEGQVISAKVADSDKYLTVDETGIHTKGIDDAISGAVSPIAERVQALELVDNFTQAEFTAFNKGLTAELAKKIETGTIAHAVVADEENGIVGVPEGVTVEGTALKIIVDAPTRAETIKLIADQVEDITGGESAAAVKALLKAEVERSTSKDTEHTNAIVTISDKLATIEQGAQVNKLESVVKAEGAKISVSGIVEKTITIDDSALQELIGANKSNIESLTIEVGKKALASDVTALSGRVDANAQRITAIELVDAQQTSDIQALQLAVNGAEGVEGLVAKVAKNTSDIASLTGTVGGHTTAIGTLESKVKTIEETTIPAISTRIDGIVNTTIPAVQQSVTDLAGVVSGIDTEVKRIAPIVEAADTLSKANKTIIDKLVGTDTNKSVRDIAIDVLTETLVADDAKEAYDTLGEMSAWLKNHPNDVATMNEAIEKNASDIEALQNAVPAIATIETAGVVKSVANTVENGVQVATDGTMSVAKVNVNTLVQTEGEEIIFTAGGAV